MKKILLSSVILSGILFSNQLSTLPLNKSNLANENGGDKTAIEAYSDGVGIYTVGRFNIDNSPMNELVFIHGEEARKNGETLKDFTLNNGTNEEKLLAEQLGTVAENIIPIDGTQCDDNNTLTTNDIYLNGVCKGNLKCNDDNFLTINDQVINGECKGTAVSFSKNFELEDLFPTIMTNWNYDSSTNTYSSTGQFSSKFFKLPSSGFLRLKFELTGQYFALGLASIPNHSNWGNIHVNNYSFSYFYNLVSSLYWAGNSYYGEGIYYMFINLDDSKVIYTVNNSDPTKGTEPLYFNPNDVAIAISEGTSGGVGSVKFLEILKN